MLCKCLVWVEVLCWIDSVWSSKECVCCACDPSVHLSVPSIGLVYVATSTCTGNSLKQVQLFIYLGSLFSSDARCEKEIRR